MRQSVLLSYLLLIIMCCFITGPKQRDQPNTDRNPPNQVKNNPFLFISWLPSILATVESWHGCQGWQYAPFRAVAAPVISGSVWATGRVANTVLGFREWSSPRVQSGKLMEWQAHGEYLGPVPSQHMGGHKRIPLRSLFPCNGNKHTAPCWMPISLVNSHLASPWVLFWMCSFILCMASLHFLVFTLFPPWIIHYNLSLNDSFPILHAHTVEAILAAPRLGV